MIEISYDCVVIEGYRIGLKGPMESSPSIKLQSVAGRGYACLSQKTAIIENPSFYSDIRRFGWSSYTSVVVINMWLCI